MNEVVKISLESFINREINEVQDMVKDSATELLKRSDQSVLQIQLTNLSMYNEYLIALEKLKDRIEREDI